MNWIGLMYLGYFGAIIFAIYYTGSAAPLWALLLFPTVERKEDNK